MIEKSFEFNVSLAKCIWLLAHFVNYTSVLKHANMDDLKRNVTLW